MAITANQLLHDADLFRRAYPNWPLATQPAPSGEITITPGDDTANPGASPCGHPPFCSCPTPDPTSRLNAGGGWDIARITEES